VPYIDEQIGVLSIVVVINLPPLDRDVRIILHLTTTPICVSKYCCLVDFSKPMSIVLPVVSGFVCQTAATDHPTTLSQQVWSSGLFCCLSRNPSVLLVRLSPGHDAQFCHFEFSTENVSQTQYLHLVG